MIAAEIRERVLVALRIASYQRNLDPLVIVLSHLATAVIVATRLRDAFEAERPTEHERQSGRFGRRTEELLERAVAAEWYVRYLVGLESTPRPGMVSALDDQRLEGAIAKLGADADPPLGWQANVLRAVAASPPPRPSWWRRLTRRWRRS